MCVCVCVIVTLKESLSIFINTLECVVCACVSVCVRACTCMYVCACACAYKCSHSTSKHSCEHFKCMSVHMYDCVLHHQNGTAPLDLASVGTCPGAMKLLILLL